MNGYLVTLVSRARGHAAPVHARPRLRSWFEGWPDAFAPAAPQQADASAPQPAMYGARDGSRPSGEPRAAAQPEPGRGEGGADALDAFGTPRMRASASSAARGHGEPAQSAWQADTASAVTPAAGFAGRPTQRAAPSDEHEPLQSFRSPNHHAADDNPIAHAPRSAATMPDAHDPASVRPARTVPHAQPARATPVNTSVHASAQAPAASPHPIAAHAPPRAFDAASRGARAETTVVVNIGRVEVRATPQSNAHRAHDAHGAPRAMTLDEYLRRHGGR